MKSDDGVNLHLTEMETLIHERTENVLAEPPALKNQTYFDKLIMQPAQIYIVKIPIKIKDY